MANSTVSICMPTYNGAAHVVQALKSALAQTLRPLEIVVSDSGSTDGTLELVRDVARGAETNVRILDQTTRGMVPNWNASVTAAQGQFIKFLFQDDLLAPHCLERMMALAERSNRVNLVFCRRHLLVDESAKDSETAKWLLANPNLQAEYGRLSDVQPGGKLLGSRSLFRSPINKIGEPTVVLARRDALTDLGLFNIKMRQLVDWEMWVRLLATGDVGYVDEPLASFRVHGSQMSGQNRSSGADNGDGAALLATFSQASVYRHLHPSAKLYLHEQLEANPVAVAPSLRMSEKGFRLARSAVRACRGLVTWSRK